MDGHVLVHSALKLEKKNEISKVQKDIFCHFKNGKKSIFGAEKSLRLTKMHFWTFLLCKNCFLAIFENANNVFLYF